MSVSITELTGKNLNKIQPGSGKLRIFYINMNFIEQNIHILCNTKSYECHLMKNIKG